MILLLFYLPSSSRTLYSIAFLNFENFQKIFKKTDLFIAEWFLIYLKYTKDVGLRN